MDKFNAEQYLTEKELPINDLTKANVELSQDLYMIIFSTIRDYNSDIYKLCKREGYSIEHKCGLYYYTGGTYYVKLKYLINNEIKLLLRLPISDFIDDKYHKIFKMKHNLSEYLINIDHELNNINTTMLKDMLDLNDKVNELNKDVF